jgi:5-methylcytosine-specific restriction endonuclease McrA
MELKDYRENHKDKYPSNWEEIEKSMIAKQPYCSLCGDEGKEEGNELQVHHIVPVHIDISKNGDENNLIVLCHHCHLRVAHCGDYEKYYNLDIKRDSKEVYDNIQKYRKEVK